MIADQLHKSILQEAMFGHMSEQLPVDGHGRDLLVEIQKEKNRLVAAGELRKTKSLPPVSEDEMPFAIPANWVWTRLGDICSQITDGVHRTPNYVTQGVPFLTIQNISKGQFDPAGMKFISKEEHAEFIKRCKPQYGDILFCRIGTLGRPYKVVLDFEFSIFVSLALIKPIDRRISDFLVRYISSPTVDSWIDTSKVGGGTHTNKINLGTLATMPVPLPPLEEQDRILARLDQIHPQIDLLARDERELDALRRRFPDNLRNSILQDAISGCITEQLPSDGDARDLLSKMDEKKARLVASKEIRQQKPLSQISEDEIPFKIPANWSWVRLGDLVIKAQSGGTPDRKNSSYYGGEIPFVSIRDMTRSGMYLRETNNSLTVEGVSNSSAWLVPPGHLLYSMYASIGKVTINTVPVTTSQAIICLDLGDDENLRKYAYWFLRAMEPVIYRFAAGSAQLNINAKIVKNLPFPLPPSSEQQRIVYRVEELMAQIDMLEADELGNEVNVAR